MDNRLWLTDLTIGDDNNHYPEIGGVRPVFGNYNGPTYSNLREMMLITGAITIGKDHPENWPRPDIRSVHDYLIVIKVTLQGGVVRAIEDISRSAAEIRNQIRQVYEERHQQPGFPHVESRLESEVLDKLFDKSWALRYSMDESE
jgi:hypothetical protein